ncbi:ABC transporter permease (plasmid) [Deinococcus sp. AJ005]|nr:ABC transporter permease [Deinococcus sp. AJ005]
MTGVIPALLAAVLALVTVEGLLRAYGVPPGLIPTPTRVVTALYNSRTVLLGDARVTFVQEALLGYIAGVTAGILVALAAVRFPFLERGALPYAGLFASIPIVALAPVIVKAFGLEWPSKAIIVGITVFFPVVVNVVRGLQSANPLLLDLMQTYAVTPAASFRLVRVPSALPFLFNALKIGSTLALIGAIVGEFFGTTGQGLGFRIQIEAGRFNLDIVWAAIVIASVLGIAFYGVISWLEARFTGWHASRRQPR